MKNTIIFIVAALAILYFVKEGEKIASTGTETLSNAEKLKLGLASTLKNLISKADAVTSSVTTMWQPESVHDKMPLAMMDNANDPAFSKFTGITLLPKRGNFIRNEYRNVSSN